MKVLVQILLLSIFFGLSSATAFADDLTPAEEEVCDFLQGSEFTPGLFGLCNAYCEAKDCDAYGPYEDQPQSCQRLYDNFVARATGADDPLEPPCLEDEEPDPDPDPVLCPCWATDVTEPIGTADALQEENLPTGEGATGFCFVEPENQFIGVGLSDDIGPMVTFILSGSTCDYGVGDDPPLTVSNLLPVEVTSCMVDIVYLQDTYTVGFDPPCPQEPVESE